MDEFVYRLETYLTEIRQARRIRCFDALCLVAEECADFLHLRAREEKGKYPLCEPYAVRYYEEQGGIARDRADGRCELCGREGDQVHHLCKRGPLKVYHQADLLLWVCGQCHNRFHG